MPVGATARSLSPRLQPPPALPSPLSPPPSAPPPDSPALSPGVAMVRTRTRARCAPDLPGGRAATEAECVQAAIALEASADDGDGAGNFPDVPQHLQ